MYIQRDLEEKILRHLKSPEIIAIVGPRQCGKTTLISHIFEGLDKAVSISFDDRSALNLFENDTESFISIYVKGNKYLFIDEFQYAKKGGRILKYIYDKHKIKMFISGSSSVDLTVKAVKYLVGRIIILNLYPFDFSEFLRAQDENYFKIYKEYKTKINFKKPETVNISDAIHQKLLHYYEEYLLFGGYPRIVLEENYESKKELLKNIYNTYFLREVRDILGLIDDYKIGNLVKALALQTGGLIEYGDLSRVSGCSYQTLKKYLNFLEKTYICILIRPFFKNKRIEVVKNPKVYFFDTGLRNSIIGDFRKIEERTDKGAILENGLAMQFIKEGIDFNFWRDKRKNEIDFILDIGNGKRIAVESKNFLRQIETPSIKAFRNIYPGIDIHFSYKDIDGKIFGLKGAYPAYLF